jgi:hypothetical protein
MRHVSDTRETRVAPVLQRTHECLDFNYLLKNPMLESFDADTAMEYFLTMLGNARAIGWSIRKSTTNHLCTRQFIVR